MSAPDKEYFTLTEIMDRWARFNVDQTTLLDYARKDLIVYSVYLSEIGSHKHESVDDEGVARPTTVSTLRFYASKFTHEPIRYLKADDARRVLEARGGEQVAVSVLYKSVDRDKESGTGYMQPHYFASKDLLITKAERDRFEKEYKLKVGSRFKTLWKWLADPNNQKALTLVGSLVTAIGVAAWQLYVRFIS